jgi:adenosine deaminase
LLEYIALMLINLFADALTRVMFEVCEDAVADGVRYLEVRFSPILHVQQGLR